MIIHHTFASKATLKLPSPRQHGTVHCAGSCVESSERHARASPLPQPVSQGGLPVILVGVGQGELAVLRVAPRVAEGEK
jgi:hypothetical protein